jgi:rhamnose transport system substrate-binding protein
MKKFKKLLALGLSISMIASALVGCSTTSQPTTGGTGTENTSTGGSSDSLEGAHVFMFKSTGNTFGDLMFEGFEEYMKAKGLKAVYKSPAETTVAAQVQLLDELITQKVASITISTNGDAGYDEVFKKAKDAGITITSIDSAASPDYRTTHVNQADPNDIGAYLVQAAVLITLGIDYPEDGDMKAAVTTALSSYSSDEIVLGVLSASIDTPVQNSWIAAMEVELKDSVYTGKVSPTIDKKYGNDDLTESTTQAQAFVAENKVNCIISPTTVGIAAAGQTLKSTGSKIKLTGLGLPSEMQSFMPSAASDDAFASVCPYMMLWDVIHLGAVSAASTLATIDGSFDGAIGSSFQMEAFREYPATTYEAYDNEDGGTAVLAGTPYVFYKGNMADWVKKL